VIKVFLTRVVRWFKIFTGNSGYISTSRLILEGELATGTFMVIGLTMCCRYQHRITDKIERIKDIPSHDRVKFCVIIVRNVSIDILRKNSKVVYGQDFDNIHDEKAKHIEDDFVEDERTIL